MNIGTRIIECRNALNWSQQDLAERMEMTQSVISRMESGKRKVSHDEVQKLAQVFGLELNEFLSDSKVKTQLKVDDEHDSDSN